MYSKQKISLTEP